MSEVGNVTAGGMMSAAGNGGKTGSLQSLGKDDFLQLMITKLQNQDPLSPMQDEDYIAQLAQFSSLEQMTNIADGIAQSNQFDYLQMQSINNVMAAGLIGKEVQASYDKIYFDGSARPNITLTTAKYAENLTLEIRDSEGNLVAQLTDTQVSPGKHTFEWDGNDQNGNRVAEGEYTVAAKATDSSGGEFRPSLGMIGVVEAVTYRNGSAYFRVDGMEIPFGDVSAIGEPGQLSEG